MFNRFSIRIRLVGITMFILILCCIGITLIINYSATQMTIQVVDIFVPAKEVVPVQHAKPTDALSQIYQSDLSMAPTEDIEKAKQQAQVMDAFYKNSILYMFFIILFGAVLMYFFSKRILLPLATLNAKIKNSTISNLSDKIIVPEGNDEIKELAVSFNKMTDGLHEAVIFQQQFSANVAHELRTPLTILKTKIEVFNKRDNSNLTEYKQLISELQNQITRLSDIIQTLLKLTNTDAIEDKEYISVADIVESIIEEFSAISSQKHIQFLVDYEDVDMYGDIDSIYQLFYNLIQNGIKYNVDHGVISISARNENKKTLINIWDMGLGIASEHKKHIFKPFFRVDTSRSRCIGGVGLGLSIVKHIVDKHGGTISISDHQPQGTCFTIEFPLPR
ncbi:sensor histidine kinase [Amedibacillus sp. YH-ame6]